MAGPAPSSGGRAVAMARAVFLDRDGVINRAFVRGGKPYAPTTLADFAILPDVPGATKTLREAGFLLIVATNQPDIATGKSTFQTVAAMHALLKRLLPLDDIRVCFHVDADNCDCRKPKPGMLLAAAADHRIALADSWMVGDRWRDVGAGRAAGCRTVFVDHGYDEPLPEGADLVVSSLGEAVPFILADAAPPP